MSKSRIAGLLIRAAILFLLLCLAVLFLAAGIMSRKYAEGPDNSQVLSVQCDLGLTS